MELVGVRNITINSIENSQISFDVQEGHILKVLSATHGDDAPLINSSANHKYLKLNNEYLISRQYQFSNYNFAELHDIKVNFPFYLNEGSHTLEINTHDNQEWNFTATLYGLEFKLIHHEKTTLLNHISDVYILRSRGISYQAIAYDNNGFEMSSQEIQLQLSILGDSINGSAEYVESHTVTTDDFGLFSVVIGSGYRSNLSSVNWKSPKFLKVEMQNGEEMTTLGVSQFYLSLTLTTLKSQLIQSD